MAQVSGDILLKGGHVLDPGRGIDRVQDVYITEGMIADRPSEGGDLTTIDVSGCYVSPGWVDLHVHAYGTLGFADADSIGVYQGVTSFVDAGGPGIGTMDQFVAMTSDLKTSLYAGTFIRPMGLLGLNFIEGDVRTIGSVPVTEWIDFVRDHPGLIRYVKCNAIGDYGPGTLKLTKGLAEILGLPLYMHVGEFQQQKPDHLLAMEAFKVAERGDMITHLYHGNLGQVVDKQGRVEQDVRDAAKRGVLFDLGFGGYNFSWDVAEAAFAQDLIPHTISSDLQQFNVVRPAKSLANVMSVMLRLGMSLKDVVERVTINPARALSLDDRAGSLAPGRPADITVFRVDPGTFELSDCYQKMRTADRQVTPVMTFKRGERFEADMERGQSESNWFLQFAEDHVPDAAAHLTSQQLSFLRQLAEALSRTKWQLASAERLDIGQALALQDLFHEVRARSGLPLRESLMAVYDCFLDSRFPMQVGLFLLRLEQSFALARLKEITDRASVAA